MFYSFFVCIGLTDTFRFSFFQGLPCWVTLSLSKGTQLCSFCLRHAQTDIHLKPLLKNKSRNETHLYFTPVLPNPPAPLSVSDNSEVSTNSACSHFATTNCAIRSPSSTTKSSSDKFTKITPTSPL